MTQAATGEECQGSGGLTEEGVGGSAGGGRLLQWPIEDTGIAPDLGRGKIGSSFSFKVMELQEEVDEVKARVE